jgi:translation initiation factor IF-3
VTFKEVRLKPKIGTGDFDTKVRRAIQFLEEGDRIKVAVQFRGRELTHPEIGRNLLAKFADQIKDHGVVERAPLLEGKSMHITVASTHKPKVVEHAARHGDEPAPATETTEAVTAPAPTAAPSAPIAETLAPVAEAAAPLDESVAPAPVAEAPAPVAETLAPVAEVAAPLEASVAPAPPRTPRAASPKPTAKAASTAPKTTAAKATASDDSKPAPRPARTRKPIEPEAPAAAPAGE